MEDPPYFAGCPGCGQFLTIAVRSLGARLLCPACARVVQIDATMASATPPVAIAAGELLEQGLPANRAVIAVPFPDALEADEEFEPEPPPVIVSNYPLAVPVQLLPFRNTFLSRVPLRWKRYAISSSIWLGPPLLVVLMLTVSSQPILSLFFGLPCCALPVWAICAYASMLVTPYVMASVFRTMRCPHCNEDYPLVNRWQCACGFNDHRERNAYVFRCPLCRKRVGHFQCLRCEATILL